MSWGATGTQQTINQFSEFWICWVWMGKKHSMLFWATSRSNFGSENNYISKNSSKKGEQHLLHMCHPVEVIGRTLCGTPRPGHLTVWGQTRAAPLQSGHAGTSHHVDIPLQAVNVLYNVIYTVLTTIRYNDKFLGDKCSRYKEHLL